MHSPQHLSQPATALKTRGALPAATRPAPANGAWANLQRASTCACGGSCPRCQSSVSGLKISEPNDPYEREADAVAHKVMRSTGVGSTASASGPVSAAGHAAHAPASVHDALSSTGRPLTAEARAFFEPRFGRDLSGVRLHTGAAAERSAREISASAYTVGRDIVFGNGGLAPEAPAGRWLMAHELAHVLQQGAGEATVFRQFFIYAGGYPNPYKDEAEETASIKAKTWMPSSTDFSYTAHAAGGGLGVKTIDELFGTIQEQGIHSITELGLIGHGAGGAIGFSGTVAFKPEATVTFTDDGLITTESLLAASTAVPECSRSVCDRRRHHALRLSVRQRPDVRGEPEPGVWRCLRPCVQDGHRLVYHAKPGRHHRVARLDQNRRFGLSREYPVPYA